MGQSCEYGRGFAEAAPVFSPFTSKSSLPPHPSTMPQRKRQFLATAEATSTPPPSLEAGHTIARVTKAEGSNLYTVEIPSRTEPLLVELPAKFRSTIWMKRGGYVVIDTKAFENRENKLQGEIVNVVREEKQWRKQSYWLVSRLRQRIVSSIRHRPKEFTKITYAEESDDALSPMGEMPSSSGSGSES